MVCTYSILMCRCSPLARSIWFNYTCADDGTLIVSTESDGTYFLYKGEICISPSTVLSDTCCAPPLDGSYSLVLDKTVTIGQVVVAHKHHLLLFRTGQYIGQ